MNTIKKLMIMLTFFTALSCSEFIDNEITGQQNLDNFFSNDEEAERALLGCYASLSPQDWWQMDFYRLIGDVCSDDALKGNSLQGDQREFGDFANFNINPTNTWLETQWRFCYQGIFRCNLIIKNVPVAPLDPSKIDLYVAEAKFLRAVFYFDLVNSFGGVPLVLTPLTANEARLARSTPNEVWAQIEKDLLEASEFLLNKSEQDANNIGRATRGAALSFLAKACLYQNKFAQAQQYANQVIQSGQYNLNANFANVWSINNPNSMESIFEIQHSYNDLVDSGSALPVVTRSRSDGGWGFATPSSNLDNFMGNDPRRVHTIIRHGESVGTDFTSYDTNLAENMSGRINKKYYIPIASRPANETHKRSALNHILFRYADLLLMHAEASFKNGDEATARNSVNLVRTRVGLPGINTSGNQLLEDIYKERRLELALEGHRYFDLKRTGRLTTAIQQFRDYNLNTSTDPYDAGNTQGQFFNPAIHTLFPIPITEIDLSNGLIVQNPGY